MAFKTHGPHQTFKPHFSLSMRPATILTSAIIATTFFFLSFRHPYRLSELPLEAAHLRFHGDLRDARFAWNKLCFGPVSEKKLRLAVFSKKWPVGAVPGGMERHAHALFTELAARGHEVHVFTVASDRRHRQDVVDGSLHLHFATSDTGSLNCSLAMGMFYQENDVHPFDYVHTESVSLPPWRAKHLPAVAATWHGIWYEIMHSTLFENLLWGTPASDPQLNEAMPRLVEEIRFFSAYKQHICISDSAGDILTNVYQLPPRDVHVILNGVDHKQFVHDPISGARFRAKLGVPENTTLVMGIAGRLVKDKGHPLLYDAFSGIRQRHPGVLLLVAGSGPWARRYEELQPQVKVLGALSPSELSQFYNAIDVFVNPTVRPQGLDLTLMEAMHCGKPLLAPNFPSIRGTVVMNDGLGYTFAPNVESLTEALEWAIKDGPDVLKEKGMACKEYALSMFTASKMASAYERFFLCMKDNKYCQYPLPSDC